MIHLDFDQLAPETRFDFRHLASVPTLTIPAVDGQEQVTVHAIDTPLVWRVRDVDGMRVEVLEMFYNWRVTLATPESVEGAWCYFGKGWGSFQVAVRAADAFDPRAQAAPVGYGKEALAWTGADATVRTFGGSS